MASLNTVSLTNTGMSVTTGQYQASITHTIITTSTITTVVSTITIPQHNTVSTIECQNNKYLVTNNQYQ